MNAAQVRPAGLKHRFSREIVTALVAVALIAGVKVGLLGLVPW